jgi:8-oxo-dGTP pyrophosphatase MutT (NUDIX family)
MLDLSLGRSAAPANDAATLVLVRDAGESGVEVFCVERNKKSRFVGGAIVFPGGKLDPSDAEGAWLALVTAPRRMRSGFAETEAHLRALAIAAVRETLEEAAIVHVAGGALDDRAARALRDRHASDPGALCAFLSDRRLRLDLAALHPFARWVTPEAEARRYDTRFFLAVAPPGQLGAHDAHETMASFWATPAEVLRRFDAGDVQLVPPTHRSLEVLAGCRTSSEALALAENAALEAIRPRLVKQDDSLALVLPGDPEHPDRTALVPGSSRYVLRGERWQAEDAPH